MLHIFLVILKIAGILLAVLLGIVVILLLSLLFVPLCYKIEGTYKEVWEIRGRASFLGPVLRLYLYYGEELEYKLRVFGIPVFRSPKAEKKRKTKKEPEEIFSGEVQQEEEPEKKGPVLIDFDKLEEEERQREAQQREELSTEEAQQREELGTEEASEEEQIPAIEEDVQGEQAEGLIGRFTERIRYKWKQLLAKLKSIFALWENIRDIKEDERVRTGVGRLKEEIFLLIRKVRPRKLKGFMRVGFEDPANTGKFLGLMAVLQSLWNTRISIQPEFERRIFETEFVCNGFIQGFRLVRLGWKYYFDKEIQYAVQKGKNIRRK